MMTHKPSGTMGIFSNGFDMSNLWVRWFKVMTCVGSWTENQEVMSAMTLRDIGVSLLERPSQLLRDRADDFTVYLWRP